MSTRTDHWLSEVLQLVRPHLPSPPRRVIELGCGPVGGLVPALVAEGYDATGVDPLAPAGPQYVSTTFESAAIEPGVHAFVACTSLHHVDELDDVLDRAAALLVPSGSIVVLEWDWERFGEASARWCFDRLPQTVASEEHAWLHRHRDRWIEARQPWSQHLRDWALGHGIHTGSSVLDELDRRFVRTGFDDAVPYFFSDLVRTSAADERAAIAAGDVNSGAFLYIGTTRSGRAP